ncbi:LysR family transcriptional regulator [Companilactobacillus furfuricola]|uniref:LysR family transcriptional regulator n=1 Tax=Companilactobacillus furfuricola TaxID=1462575 RepID=UPI000F7ABEA6|nr:LysR family transcriptional regulator [Companilactobacillus furfuricola]
MDLNHLRYFLALSRTENYTKTAKLLHITQPSLTKSIHVLESEIGTNLFEKNGRGVQLTPQGRLFANNISATLYSLDQSISQIQNLSSPKRDIKLVSLRNLSIKWLPEMAQQFLQFTDDPTINLDFSIGNGMSPQMLRDLRRKKYDVAFCSKLDGYDDIDFTPIAEQTMVCITPINHPLANRTNVTLKETLAYPQITFAKESGLASIMTKLFDDAGGQPISSYSVEEDQAIAGLVANNFGIAIVPNMAILENMPVKVIPLSFPKWQRILYMAVLKQNTLRPEIASFVKFIQQQSRDLAVNKM